MNSSGVILGFYNFTMKLVNVRIYSDMVTDYGVFCYNGGSNIYQGEVIYQEGIVDLAE